MLGLRARYPGAVFASALTREGLPELREATMHRLLDGAWRAGTKAREDLGLGPDPAES